MFFRKETEKSRLDNAIDAVVKFLDSETPGTKEYDSILAQLDKLYKLREIDKPKIVNRETLALIAGNLAGILLILNYERAHVVTSRAIGFVTKLR